MELQDFLAKTLEQIIGGIKQAQEATKTSGGLIVPGLESIKFGNTQLVDFDVALGAAEGQSRTGGIGVLLSAVTLGGKAESESRQTSQTSIRFSVPVEFPRGIRASSRPSSSPPPSPTSG